MEQVNNGMALDILQSIAVQNQPPKAGSKSDGDFQKLMDKAASGRDAKAEEALIDEFVSSARARANIGA